MGHALPRILLALAICLMLSPRPAANAEQRRLRVVATFSILGDLIKNVGGDNVALVTLVGANGDSHTFEPTPADARTILDAEIVFENGFGLEPWFDRLYQSSRASAPRIRVTEGIEPMRNERGEVDPHFWHDVSRAATATRTIRDALAGIDPANAESYVARADLYLSRLEMLDTWVIEQVASLPVERRKLVTSHDTFEYFASRYGLQIVGFALPLTTEAQPSAQQITRLVRDIRSTGVPVVFVENVSDARLLQRIAREAGVAVGPELYTDALGSVNSPASTYVDLITYNVRTMVAYLAR